MTDAAHDPFKIEGPALISFSGGRTSGYMLWRILQAHGGTLPDDVKVTFANTGKEMPQTLDFVRDCGERWGVNIAWLEYRRIDGKHAIAVVDYETASRNGEPFSAIIAERKMLPNPTVRFCTVELKIRTMARYGRRELGWHEFDKIVGLRADEPRRVSRMRGRSERSAETGEREVLMPLADAGVTKRDVETFWRKQNFTLGLPTINGTTPAGNCDLCFLKSAATVQGMMRDTPTLAAWWIEAEAEAKRQHYGKNIDIVRFRKDRPSYAEMFKAVKEQRAFDFGIQDEIIDCFCGDGA